MWCEHELGADHYIPRKKRAPHTRHTRLTNEQPHGETCSTNLLLSLSPLSRRNLLTVCRPVPDCAPSATTRAVDLCDPGPQCCCCQPTTFSCSGAGRSRRETGWQHLLGVNRQMIGGSQEKPSLWVLTPVGFVPIDSQKSRVYSLLCFVYGCPAGGARQGWPLCKGCWWWEQAARTGQPVG